MTTPSTSVLIIYTGGTIGMTQNTETGALEPFDFNHLLDNVPELRRLGYSVSTTQFDPIIDSSETEPSQWAKIVQVIADNYNKYDGFVVLHGTDTMAYTASAVSFMLELRQTGHLYRLTTPHRHVAYRWQREPYHCHRDSCRPR